MSPARHRAAAAILCIHTDTVLSGAALSVPEFRGKRVTGYEVMRMGEVKTQRGREDWIKNALVEAQDAGVPLVVVGDPLCGFDPSDPIAFSANREWGKWLAAIERVGEGAHVLEAPSAWAREDASEHAERKLKLPLLHERIAKAVCLRPWAEHAPEVAAVLAPKKKRKAA